MSQPVLPDPPDKFSSYDSWKQLSNAALYRSQSLWAVRDEMRRALDDTIAFHDRQHAWLSAAYEDERRRYLAAHDRFEVASAGSGAELDCLNAMFRHLETATRLYDKLIDGRGRIDRKFEAWMDLHGFGGKAASAGEAEYEIAKRRNANRRLSQLRRLVLQERQDALNNRLVLGNMLRDIAQRLEECDVCPVDCRPARAGHTHKSLRELNALLARFASTSDPDELADRRPVRP